MNNKILISGAIIATVVVVLVTGILILTRNNQKPESLRNNYSISSTRSAGTSGTSTSATEIQYLSDTDDLIDDLDAMLRGLDTNQDFADFNDISY